MARASPTYSSLQSTALTAARTITCRLRRMGVSGGRMSSPGGWGVRGRRSRLIRLRRWVGIVGGGLMWRSLGRRREGRRWGLGAWRLGNWCEVVGWEDINIYGISDMMNGVLLLTMGGINTKASGLLICERCRQTTLKFFSGERGWRVDEICHNTYTVVDMKSFFILAFLILGATVTTTYSKASQPPSRPKGSPSLSPHFPISFIAPQRTISTFTPTSKKTEARETP